MCGVVFLVSVLAKKPAVIPNRLIVRFTSTQWLTKGISVATYQVPGLHTSLRDLLVAG